MVIDPKEFTEDCISTLDIEKTAPDTPAGRPILTICTNFSFDILSLESVSL